MELFEAFLQSASYIGVIEKLMALSNTDIAVLFLVSKPAFLLTAGLVVFTSRKRRDHLELPGESSRPELPE